MVNAMNYGFVLLITTLTISIGYAQGLPDPTKPSIGVPTNDVNNNNTSSAPSALQSVILPKKGKPIAIINGRQVTIGDKLDEERVTKITENYVELKGASGTRVLKMSPDVEKKLSTRKPAANKQPASHPK